MFEGRNWKKKELYTKNDDQIWYLKTNDNPLCFFFFFKELGMKIKNKREEGRKEEWATKAKLLH
jgi:hypothetical protein